MKDIFRSRKTAAHRPHNDNNDNDNDASRAVAAAAANQVIYTPGHVWAGRGTGATAARAGKTVMVLAKGGTTAANPDF